MKQVQDFRNLIALSTVGLLIAVVFSGCGAGVNSQSHINTPYILNLDIESRSISFESPTGAKGQAAKAASPLGVGR